MLELIAHVTICFIRLEMGLVEFSVKLCCTIFETEPKRKLKKKLVKLNLPRLVYRENLRLSSQSHATSNWFIQCIRMRMQKCSIKKSCVLMQCQVFFNTVVYACYIRVLVSRFISVLCFSNFHWGGLLERPHPYM